MSLSSRSDREMISASEAPSKDAIFVLAWVSGTESPPKDARLGQSCEAETSGKGAEEGKRSGNGQCHSAILDHTRIAMVTQISARVINLVLLLDASNPGPTRLVTRGATCTRPLMRHPDVGTPCPARIRADLSPSPKAIGCLSSLAKGVQIIPCTRNKVYRAVHEGKRVPC